MAIKQNLTGPSLHRQCPAPAGYVPSILTRNYDRQSISDAYRAGVKLGRPAQAKEATR